MHQLRRYIGVQLTVSHENRLEAVHERDLADLLTAASAGGLSVDVRCRYCGAEAATAERIGAIERIGRRVLVSCSAAACATEISEAAQ